MALSICSDRFWKSVHTWGAWPIIVKILGFWVRPGVRKLRYTQTEIVIISRSTPPFPPQLISKYHPCWRFYWRWLRQYIYIKSPNGNNRQQEAFDFIWALRIQWKRRLLLDQQNWFSFLWSDGNMKKQEVKQQLSRTEKNPKCMWLWPFAPEHITP